MASFSNTELNATIDEKWDMEIEEARYANAVIMPRIANKSGVVKKSGDRINVTVKPKYTVGDVGSNGAFVPQTITPTSVAVVVDQHKQVAIETEDKAEAQSFWDPESDFPKDAGAAMAVKYDTDIAALHGDFTSNVVGEEGTPEIFGTSKVRAALLKLADRNVPLRELSFLLPPIAFYSGVFTEAQLTAADAAGLPKNVLTTNYRFPLLGVPAYETTCLTTVGTAIKGLLLHKSAMAIAMQKNNEIKRAERTSALVLSYVVVIQSLYGIKTIREDHGVVINIRNS